MNESKKLHHAPVFLAYRPNRCHTRPCLFHKNTRLRQDLPLARQRNGERNSKTLYKYFTETNNMFVYKP